MPRHSHVSEEEWKYQLTGKSQTLKTKDEKKEENKPNYKEL